MIGTRLKELREEKKLDQGEFAEILNISRSAIGMYERGKREPNDELKKQMANFFGCTIDYLVGNSECRGETMGLFTDLDKINERLEKIRKFAKETADKIVDMEMTFDDYEYFRNRLNDEIRSRQIGKK